MHMAFEWFLGRNQLAQVMYNRASGGCYDGLEEHSVNLNQGAESTVCYLLARTTMECHRRKSEVRMLTARPAIAPRPLAVMPRSLRPISQSASSHEIQR